MSGSILRFIKARNLPLDQVLITAVNSHYTYCYMPRPIRPACRQPSAKAFRFCILPGTVFQRALRWIQGGETQPVPSLISGGTSFRPVEAGRLSWAVSAEEGALPAIENAA